MPAFSLYVFINIHTHYYDLYHEVYGYSNTVYSYIYKIGGFKNGEKHDAYKDILAKVSFNRQEIITLDNRRLVYNNDEESSGETLALAAVATPIVDESVDDAIFPSEVKDLVGKNAYSSNKEYS